MPQKIIFKKLSEKEIRDKLYGEYTLINFYKSDQKKKAATLNDTRQEKQKKEILKQEIGLIKHEIEDAKKAFLKMDRQKKDLDKKITSSSTSALSQRKISFSNSILNSISFLRISLKFTFALIAIIFLLYLIPLLYKNLPLTVKTDRPSKQENSKKGFTIQVAEYERFPEANNLIAYLKNKGFQAHIFTTESRQGRQRYRIYVGVYQDEAGAQGILNRLRSEENFSDAFVRQR